MNDGGALLTREQMHQRLRELAHDHPVVSRGLNLSRLVAASGEETALLIAIAAVEALGSTQQRLLEQLRERPPCRGQSMRQPTDDEIMKLAGEWFHTGENQKRDDGYYYRSLGTPSNVRGTDLIKFARAAIAIGRGRDAGGKP